MIIKESRLVAPPCTLIEHRNDKHKLAEKIKNKKLKPDKGFITR